MVYASIFAIFFNGILGGEFSAAMLLFVILVGYAYAGSAYVGYRLLFRQQKG
jgi:hypothetical protein